MRCRNFILLFSLFYPTIVFANPNLINVDGGIASVTQNGNQTIIQQSSDRAILNWNNFDVGAGSSAIFNQPSNNALTVNRIAQSGLSTIINGTVSANGHLVFINPAGIIFGNDSVINTRSLIASTNDILNNDVFDNDLTLNFNDYTPLIGNIELNGIVNAAQNGNIIINGNDINIGSTINGNKTKIEIATGDAMTIDLSNGTGLVALSVNNGTININNAEIKAGHESINIIAGDALNIAQSKINSGEGALKLEAVNDIRIRNSIMQSTGDNITIQTSPNNQGQIEINDSIIASKGGTTKGIVDIDTNGQNMLAKQIFIADNRVVYAVDNGGDISIRADNINGNNNCIVSGADRGCANFPEFNIDTDLLNQLEILKGKINQAQSKSVNRVKEITPIITDKKIENDELISFNDETNIVNDEDELNDEE